MADSTAATGSDESEQQITFTIKSSAEAKYTLTLPISTTIGDIKQKLSTSEYASLPPDRQRLIYSGRVLKDADTIASCKIKDGNTVHLVRGAESNSRQNPANQGGTASPQASGHWGGNAPGWAQPPPASNVPSNIAAGTGTSNPLAHLTGARYAGFHGLPGMDAFGADGGMGAPPNPDQMLRLLEDPNFAQQMNEAMDNPAVLDMLRNNPMIRNNPMARQAIDNPELRRMMFNPEMIRMQMRMQQQMNPGGAGSGSFPMPGQTDTTQPSATDPATTGSTDAAAPAESTTASNTNTAASNPFAALFGGGGAGTGDQQQPGTNRTGSQSNPMAAMAQQMMQNPDMMRQAMQMMQGMGGAGGAGGAGGDAAGGNQQNPFGGFNPFMFGGMGDLGGQQEPQAPADTRPPEERYESQLRQLNDMGFFEFERNVQALRRSGGSVQGAVEYLLSNP